MENQLHVKMAVAHTAFRGPVMSASAMCGLLPGQPKVLEYLAVHPGCQRKEIAAAWNADKSTLSGLIARMERDGLLVSSENAADKRGKTLGMTEKGQKAYDKLQPMLEKIDRTAKKGISDEELEIFYRVLDKMRVNLENYSHSPDEKRKEIKSNNE